MTLNKNDNKTNDRTNVNHDNKGTETSDIIRNNRETSTKYIRKGTHLQEFPLNIFELKNDSVNQLENIMRKKHINQDNQLINLFYFYEYTLSEE